MKSDDGSLRCEICPRHCVIREGQYGFCRGRKNEGGKNVCANYPYFTALALDPIEKKPLRRFFPGTRILSAGTFGCNLTCPFCQNYTISQVSREEILPYCRELSARELASLVLSRDDSIGIAFTYNEPLISYDYIIETARLVRPHKKVVIVTNGCVTPQIMAAVLPFTDAMNIDLKGGEDFYREKLGGDYMTVLENIRMAAGSCHVEVTTLVIPGVNDSDDFIKEEASWLAGLSEDLPLHLSRYFPRYRCAIPATPPETIFHLQKLARNYLNYVYTGNV
ncbi:MAG: AmmeMemoRadiSam system radical SAM enzyme [Lachnospiraceae bacterium]|jgi:pyruvate formate lyase activating enzyme